jgi:hypothetical protein
VEREWELFFLELGVDAGVVLADGDCFFVDVCKRDLGGFEEVCATDNQAGDSDKAQEQAEPAECTEPKGTLVMGEGSADESHESSAGEADQGDVNEFEGAEKEECLSFHSVGLGQEAVAFFAGEIPFLETAEKVLHPFAGPEHAVDGAEGEDAGGIGEDSRSDDESEDGERGLGEGILIHKNPGDQASRH